MPKNILFKKEFNANIKALSQFVNFIILLVVILLLKTIYYASEESLDKSFLVAIILAGVFLLCCLIFFKRHYQKVLLRITEHAAKYNGLLTMSREIQAEKDIGVLLERIIDHAVSLTGADGGAILVMEEGSRLVAKANRGARAYDVVLDGAPSLTAQTILSGVVLRVEQVKKSSAYANEVDGMAGLQANSFLCAPLTGEAGVVGVIKLIHSDPDRFSPEDEEMISYMAAQAAISINNARFIEDQNNYEINITELLLQAMDNHLTIKVDHSRRVSKYCDIVAAAIGMNPERRKVLQNAALLHDVGFIKFLPSEEMQKESYLKHATVGHALVEKINFYRREAEIILHHHERFDGKGYPAMLSGEDIPLEARIIALAEAFDTMTNKDSYKEPLDFNSAMAEMKKNSGTQFDPQLLDVFTKYIGEII
jgi:putative nucleotidyltransferase with HDIG domain